MGKNKYIICVGDEFTIEWYYKPNGKSPARDYFESLPEERQNKLVKLLVVMARVGEVQNVEKFRNEGDKIYAFKPHPDRFLCFFFIGSKIIVTNGFEKKSQKLPPEEKDRALRHQSDYIVRVNKGIYYE